MAKTIFIILDGCGYNTATENLNTLENMVKSNICAKYKIRGELPSLSRPMYETLLTGLPASIHGIINNDTVRRSICTNIFDLCAKNGLTTAASAYLWISELYVKVPFEPAKDRIQFNSSSIINNAVYYYEDHYPDSHVVADAELIRRKFNPDFILIHTMNIDDQGHKHGSNSFEYSNTTAKADKILAEYLPEWINKGYSIAITADHGMDVNGNHGGDSNLETLVPLYIISDKTKNGDFSCKSLSQLTIAPLLCKLLDIKKSEQMQNIYEPNIFSCL